MTTYSVRTLSSTDSDIVNHGALFWGVEAAGWDAAGERIQSSFIDEMSVVSEEVRDLLSELKAREDVLKTREKAVMKQQLKLDLKDRELKSLEKHVDTKLQQLQDGSLDAVQVLENAICELKKENQRLRGSFSNLSKTHTAMKRELELAQSRSSKIEKQLSSANGRIKNLVYLQTVKPKQQDYNTKDNKEEGNKENARPVLNQKHQKPKNPKLTRPSVPENSELTSILLQALSKIDLEYYTELWGQESHHQKHKLLCCLSSYLEATQTASVVVQYPCLKLVLKILNLVHTEQVTAGLRATFRKLSEVFCLPKQYSHSPHLHCRLLSCLALLKTSSQTQVIQRGLSTLLADLQTEGAKEILVDNAGHKIILRLLEDPVQQGQLIQLLVILTNEWSECEALLKQLLEHLPSLVEMITHDNTALTLSVSILLQRLSVLAHAKCRLKQSAVLFRLKIKENPNSLVELNFKSVLMNIDCYHQVPVT